MDELDRRIFRAIYKLSAKKKLAETLGKIKNPKVIGVMYSYRAGIACNLASNLQLLGFEKVKHEKSLEEILAESEEGEKQNEP